MPTRDRRYGWGLFGWCIVLAVIVLLLLAGARIALGRPFDTLRSDLHQSGPAVSTGR